MSGFPDIRMRRLRRTAGLRKIFDAPMPGPEKFMYPIFVTEGSNVYDEIDAMPGQYRISVDSLKEKLAPVIDMGIGSILIFGVAGNSEKDGKGTAAAQDNGLTQQAVRELRKSFPDLVIATDVCLCAYTDHGHCGPLTESGSVDNDASVEMLQNVALSHAASGADIVAPSAMMDGQIKGIREALERENFIETILMSYSTKFCSSMYGPFREAEQSAPGTGDRKAYQQSWGDVHQAIRETLLDEQEGADILMVKPALFYLDIISELRKRTELPLAAYNVSGEYSMLIASSQKGWGDLGSMVKESISALVRSGTDIIISYWANQYDSLIAGK